MCGRAALSATPEDLREALGLDEAPELAPRYNIAPSQAVAVVRTSGRLEQLRWGLVPFWAKDVKIGRKFALARAETVLTTPAFRDAIRQRRCLVVVSGFYEWQRAGRPASQPFFVRRPDGKPFALAGIWDRWISKDGEVIETCAVVTCPAGPPLAVVHDRMPLVLERESWGRWLDPSASHDLPGMLSAQAQPLAALPVGPYVNDPRHDDARCVERANDPEQVNLFA